MTTIAESAQDVQEQSFEGYSKVKIIKNTKGINLEVTASGKDYQNLDNIKAKALQIFNDCLREINSNNENGGIK